MATADITADKIDRIGSREPEESKDVYTGGLEWLAPPS